MSFETVVKALKKYNSKIDKNVFFRNFRGNDFYDL